MGLNFNNPFQPSRFNSIMSQPVDKSFGNVDFNPAAQSSNPFQQGQMPNQKRLFSGAMPETAPKFKVQPQQQGPQDTTDAETMNFYKMLKGIGGNRPARTAYQDALQNQPNSADYQPSIWRRIGAGITGAAGGLSGGPGVGTELGERFLESPYRGALSDYQRRLQGLEQSAQMEYQDVSDERDAFTTAANYGLQRGDKQFTRQYQNRQLDQKYAELEVTRQKDLAEITHMQNQDINGANANVIAKLKADVEDRYNQGKLKIDQQNANSQGVSAGASATSAQAAINNAKANQTRADKYQPAGAKGPLDPKEAYNLVIESMYHSGSYGNSIIPSQDEYGPAYKITGPSSAAITKQARERAAKMSGQSPDYFGSDDDEDYGVDIGGGGGGVQSNQPQAESYKPFTGQGMRFQD